MSISSRFSRNRSRSRGPEKMSSWTRYSVDTRLPVYRVTLTRGPARFKTIRLQSMLCVDCGYTRAAESFSTTCNRGNRRYGCEIERSKRGVDARPVAGGDPGDPEARRGAKERSGGAAPQGATGRPNRG